MGQPAALGAGGPVRPGCPRQAPPGRLHGLRAVGCGDGPCRRAAYGRGVGGRHGGLVVVCRAVGQCAGLRCPGPAAVGRRGLCGVRAGHGRMLSGSPSGCGKRRRFRPARRCSCLAARPARGSSVGSDSIPLPDGTWQGLFPNEFWLSLVSRNRREQVRCGYSRSERLVHGCQLGRCGCGVQRVLPARHQDVRRPGSRGGLRAPAGGCLRGRLDHHERDPVGARPAALDDGCAGTICRTPWFPASPASSRQPSASPTAPAGKRNELRPRRPLGRRGRNARHPR